MHTVVDERTAMVVGFLGSEKPVTREKFISIWTAHASELLQFDINVMDEVRVKAGQEWDRIYKKQKEGK